MKSSEMDSETDEAWKKAHLTAQVSEWPVSEIAAQRYNSAYLCFQYLVTRRMATTSFQADERGSDRRKGMRLSGNEDL